MRKVDVIVLAGAPAGAEMAPEGGVASRAMIPLAGKSMLRWVVDALRGASSVGRIAAVGEVAAEGLDIVVAPGENLIENIKRGIEALEAKEPVLIASSDIPLLTAEAVEDFIERASKLDADFAYPIVPRAHCEARYPGMARTYLKTGDGVFTGGNIMLVSPEFVLRNWQTIADAYTARKQVLKLARMIGIGVLLRVLLAQVVPGALKVPMLERAASRMVGGRVAAVVSAYPEIGEDVDKPADLEAVRKLLASGGAR